MLRPAAAPFLADGGMRLVEGNLGRACFKTSAVEPDRWTIEAPCRVFDDQAQVIEAFTAGELDRDVVVVVRFQGPRANGMPELHKLTPPLGVLQDRGYRVALVTDGRMSGASGKVPGGDPRQPRGARRRAARRGCATATWSGCAADRGELSTTADLCCARTGAGARRRETAPAASCSRCSASAPTRPKGGSAMLAMAGL